MTSVDWNAVMLGLLVGVAMSVVFFTGLGFGVRMALRAEQPIRILMLSSVVRIAVLLSVGWAVVDKVGPWAVLGYGGAFLAVRTMFVTFAKIGPRAGDAS